MFSAYKVYSGDRFNVFYPCFQHVKSIAETGCKVVVSGGKVGELYLHYCNKYNLMVVRLMSKFDLRRLCKAIAATPLPRLVSCACYHHLLLITSSLRFLEIHTFTINGSVYLI